MSLGGCSCPELYGTREGPAAPLLPHHLRSSVHVPGFSVVISFFPTAHTNLLLPGPKSRGGAPQKGPLPSDAPEWIGN